MRIIGQIESEAAARRFSDFLYVQRIPNQIDSGVGDRWDVWVHDDDQLEEGKRWLDLFRQNPNESQFQIGRKADELRTIEVEAEERFRRRMKNRGDLFRRFVAQGFGPLTILLISICVGVFLISKFSTDLQKVHALFFSEVHASRNIVTRMFCSPEIRMGEVWRLLTPIFLHFGIIHIFFNMLWLRDLGGAIETMEGVWKLAFLVMAGGVISNWAQYVIDGSPHFGGMSGVVYTLFGYVWMKSKYHPGAGLYLHKQTVTMMLIWLVVCFTGWLGPIANYAHLAGLLAGVVWGFVEARLLR